MRVLVLGPAMCLPVRHSSSLVSRWRASGIGRRDPWVEGPNSAQLLDQSMAPLIRI